MRGREFIKPVKTSWIIALLLLVILKIFSLDPERVEIFYSSEFYHAFSKILRFFFGWIPFSIGDIVYLLAGCWLIWKIIKYTLLVFSKQLRRKDLLLMLKKLLFLLIIVYLIFNVFWGLNYNRKGIGYQLQLSGNSFDSTDVFRLQTLLLKKVNASKIILLRNKSLYPSNKELFKRAENCYRETQRALPFLAYKIPSLKSSFYSSAGNYLGFTGYYNPFTGEAQVNTKVPKFLQPFIAAHEMAHQLGYAKEDEASFAGYLAAVGSSDTLFHYSTYLDLFIYANREVYFLDSIRSQKTFDSLHAGVKKDLKQWKDFNLAHTSFIEPAITWMYGNYLKMNEQPKGMRSYNEVIFMLLEYYRKFGRI